MHSLPFPRSTPATMPVTAHDLTQLGEICNSICYHLVAHLSAVAAGVMPSGPPEVAQIYQLAAKLPHVEHKQWDAMARHKSSGAGSPGAAAAGAKEPGKRMKWTADTEQELIKLVEDEQHRTELLGEEEEEGCRGFLCLLHGRLGCGQRTMRHVPSRGRT